MVKRTLFACIALLQVFASIAQAPGNYSSSDILLQLKKLNTVGSVLYIAAHPDDENTRLISWLANEKCLRTGYLSLTRGDGGQNLIGSEQGIELGVIRTQELLAARRVDGGEQFFTRAYDFGFSKTPVETFEKWNHDSILSDVVWVIRNFRPDVIITRFATDGSGGHGHHTASAILAEEAFDAAADPAKFPQQLKNGVTTWKTRRMFHNSTARFFNPNADLSHLIKMDVGGYNALLGKSYGEIAAESRSMHRSQGFGSARQRGESFEYFKPLKGDTTGLKDILQGMDLGWSQRNSGIHQALAVILKNFNPDDPAQSADAISAFLQKYRSQLPSRHANLCEEILLQCLGIFQDAVAKSSSYATGEPIVINTSRMTRYEKKCAKCPYTPLQREVKDSVVLSSAQITESYWLQKPIQHDRFVLDSAAFLNKPESQRLVEVSVPLDAATKINVTRPVRYKWVDPSKGELYRPLVITPPVLVSLASDLYVCTDQQAKLIQVVVKAGKDNVTFDLNLTLPEPWKISTRESNGEIGNRSEAKNISLAKKGEEKTLYFLVVPPTSPADGVLKAEVIVDGKRYSQGMKEIKYDHIPVQTLFPQAEAKLLKLDVKRSTKTIGYIPGAGDEVADCLRQIGYEVIKLTDEMLANEDLDRYFKAIVVGVRAYNTNEKLTFYKQRLMDFVTNGGNLVVQYNTNSFAGPFKGDIGPYPFRITRDRVTDERAAVKFELPAHPVLNAPNKITEKDFEGWIQERCIYSGADTTGRYEMPISMADPGEAPNKGSVLIAKHGKGHFVYTGLVFFRELPAGVPGAYRLLANMIELGRQ